MKKSFKKLTAFVVAIVMVLAIAALAACAGKTQLPPPVIKLDGNKVSWQAVEHADSYDVTVGNKAAVNVKTTEYTVTETTPGDYAITVVAKSSDEKYTDSKPSNSITYRVSAPPADTLTVQAKAEYVVVDYDNGWTVDFSDYDFSNLIEAKFGETAITYDQLTVTAAGTTCGEKALTVTVEYGEDESEQVQFDVYYGIADKEQLRAITDLTAWYILTEDITFETSGDPYTPLGEFSGHFNGNYKKISNLDIYTEVSGGMCGLFERNTGTIENIYIASGKVYGTSINAVIAGTNNGTIRNCFVNVTKVGGGGSFAGGITYGASETDTSVGTVEGCVVIACVNTDEPRTQYGIVGYGESGTVKDNLFIPISDEGAQEALGYVGEATLTNNAAIKGANLKYDDNQFWDDTAPETKYDINFTNEIWNLVKEYLQQLSAA